MNRLDQVKQIREFAIPPEGISKDVWGDFLCRVVFARKDASSTKIGFYDVEKDSYEALRKVLLDEGLSATVVYDDEYDEFTLTVGW